MIQAKLIQRSNYYAVEVTERGDDGVATLLHTRFRVDTVGEVETLLGQWGYERATAWEPEGVWLSTARLHRWALV